MKSALPGFTLGLRSTLICSMATLFISGSGAAAADTTFHWGVVGHDDHDIYDNTYVYNKNSFEEQMHLITGSSMSWLRTSCNSASCNKLLTTAEAGGVQILKSIEMSPDSKLDEEANYKRAYASGVTEGSAYVYGFKYFEAGDELDNWVGMKGDGSQRSQYVESRYLQARGFVRGMIDGIHSVDASAKVLVDDAGWCHYGFLRMLWDDGVRWDITAFHWYNNEGNIEKAGCNNANVAQIHAAFGPPVWITEYNSNTAVSKNDPVAEGAWIGTFIAQLRTVAPKYNIQAAFAYELFDEPNLVSPISHYGIFYANGSPKFAIGPMIKGTSTSSSQIPAPPSSIRVD